GRRLGFCAPAWHTTATWVVGGLVCLRFCLGFFSFWPIYFFPFFSKIKKRKRCFLFSGPTWARSPPVDRPRPATPGVGPRKHNFCALFFYRRRKWPSFAMFL
ncbi:unnamed protein product, partial [Amoebophrya sp. A120]